MKSGFFNSLKNEFKDFGTSFVRGNWKTKLSFVVMGAGNLFYKQIVRGLAFLGIEVLFFIYLFNGLGGESGMYSFTISTFKLTTTIHSRFFYTEF